MPVCNKDASSCQRRKNIKYFLLCPIIVSACLPVAFALEPGNVVSSSGVIGEPTWGDHTVIDTQNGSIINWNDFNTSSGQSVTFHQYDGANLSNFSAVLNRISSGTVPTQFNGTLNANGRAFIVNPAGVIFGAGSSINVSQLVASGLSMSNDVFNTVIADESSRMLFDDGRGDVINNGVINAERSVYLVGQNVANNGAIHCPGGLVVMAAGNSLRIGQSFSNVIVNIDTDLMAGSNNSVTNNGTVGENLSPVAKLVLAAGDIFSQTITNVEDVETIETGEVELDGIIETMDTDFPSTGDLLTDLTDTSEGDSDSSNSNPGQQPDSESDSQLKSLQRQWQKDAKLNPRAKQNFRESRAAMFAAPVPDEHEPEISGCPALTTWAAKELRIDEGATQISIAGSMASAASIPPCDACARLRKSAGILRDYTGVYITALSAVLNEFASSDAPLSEEQNAAITVAIAGGAEGNTEYALAKEYLDALADYVAILNNEMNLSTTDSTEFVLNKYIEPLIEKENINVATFLAEKLADPSSS